MYEQRGLHIYNTARSGEDNIASPVGMGVTARSVKIMLCLKLPMFYIVSLLYKYERNASSILFWVNIRHTGIDDQKMNFTYQHFVFLFISFGFHSYRTTKANFDILAQNILYTF